MGVLVGLRTVASLHWRWASSRRLSRSHGHNDIDLALLPGEPRCAQLMAREQRDCPWGAEPGGLRGTVDALIVDAHSGQLLAPLGTFIPGGVGMDLVAGGERYPVTLQQLLEVGPDYELISYTGNTPEPAAPAAQ